MNKFLNYFTTAALILALAIFASCGGGGDVTPDWTGFTLDFNGSKDGGDYSTNVGTFDDTSLTNIWAASGTWTFVSTDTNCKSLTVKGGFNGGDRTVAISAVTASGLNLSFNVPEADTNGRTMGIAGDWFFEFNF